MIKCSISTLKFLCYSLILVSAISSATIADHNYSTDHLIILPEDKRAPFIEMLDNAKDNITICAYTISDNQIKDCILKAAQRGVKINLLIEPARQQHSKSDNIASIMPKDLNHKNIQFYQKSNPSRQLHQKYLIVDNKLAVVQTNNLDAESFDGTVSKTPNEPPARDFALITKDQDVIKQLTANFQQIASNPDYSSQSNWNDKRQDFLVFNPGPQRADLLKMIKQATQSIDMYQQNLHDEQIVNSLLDALKNNIKINIIMMKNPHGKPQDPNTIHQTQLIKAGARVHFLEHLYQHTKIIIVDAGKSGKQFAYIGSCNLFPASIDEHYETGIVTFSPETINQLHDTFKSDFLSKPAQ